jgi:hypothetical protein
MALTLDKGLIERLARNRGALLAAAAALTLVAVVATASLRGLGVGLLVLAGGVLLLSIGLVWSSVLSLTGEAQLSLDEALAMAAPRAEEEQKRAVLRALKDLDYERSVGKISDQDYEELSARYRQQARELLRSLDEELAPARERLARLVEERVDSPIAPSADSKPKKPQKARSARPAAELETPGQRAAPSAHAKLPTRTCSECHARNELDARFCKGCGQRMAAEGKLLCVACPASYDQKLAECPQCGVERPDS